MVDSHHYSKTVWAGKGLKGVKVMISVSTSIMARETRSLIVHCDVLPDSALLRYVCSRKGTEIHPWFDLKVCKREGTEIHPWFDFKVCKREGTDIHSRSRCGSTSRPDQAAACMYSVVGTKIPASYVMIVVV